MLPSMPALFIGHGSPMNAIQENAFTQSLRAVMVPFPKPQAILVISAHWLTEGTYVTSAARLTQIYDFYGFPDALYQLRYEPPGSPELAEMVRKLGMTVPIRPEAERGIDHGAWTILQHLYPQQDIPVVQLSLDVTKSEREHVAIGQMLHPLRAQGILILGSGNIVHNLRRISPEQDDPQPYPWAIEFDEFVGRAITHARLEELLAYRKILGGSADLAVPTNDHYLPLLYTEAVRQPEDVVELIYTGIQHKSISMRSYLLDSRPI
jgi:4,5-DOPA dioxygenase extradiol